MFCGKCGSSNPEDNSFCFRCGTRLQNAEAPLNTASAEGVATAPARLDIELNSSHDAHDVSMNAEDPVAPQATHTYSLNRTSALEGGAGGVGGWLGLFCIGQFITPIAFAFALSQHLDVGILPFSLAAFGVITGIKLWTIQPNALGYVKWLLIGWFANHVFRLGVATLEAQGEVFTVLEGAPPSVGGAIFGMAMTGIWYAYFWTSIRVHTTYGRNLSLL